MSAIGEFIVEFVVEPLLSLVPDPDTRLGDAILCTLSGALSASAIAGLNFFARGANPSAMPAWATTLGLFFLLLALAGLLYAAVQLLKSGRSSVAFLIAAIANGVAIALPFWLPHH